ncbi:MAG: GNAT family N-acetyltransferase [Asgard group archaeon]|nr:GNAT family N-acetyltransferase [Asgard group archaeon]
MNSIDYEILKLNPKEMSKELQELYIDLMIKLEIEFDETEQPEPREDWMKLIRNPNPKLDQTFWTVFLKGNRKEAIGFASLSKYTKKSDSYENNKEQAGIRISILKDYQRKGIGSKLLALIIKEANSDKVIKKLQAITAMESGKQFCEKYKGELKHFSIANRLVIADIDWNLMQDWVDKGLKLSKETGTIIETYDVIPNYILEEYCNLYTLILSQAPRGELEGQTIITPQSYKDQLTRFKKMNVEYCTKISREKSGEISGIIEIMFKRTNLQTIHQRFTGVKKEYRGKGIGKWLKADLMFHIRDNLPEVLFIDTGNANNNAPMLSINERMGFKLYRQVWWFYLNPDDLVYLLLEK